MKVSLLIGEWGGLDESIAEARRSFVDLSPEALESLLNEAVTSTREADAAAGGFRGLAAAARLTETPGMP